MRTESVLQTVPWQGVSKCCCVGAQDSSFLFLLFPNTPVDTVVTYWWSWCNVYLVKTGSSDELKRVNTFSFSRENGFFLKRGAATINLLSWDAQCSRNNCWCWKSLTGEALKSIRRSKLSENLALPYTLNGVLSLWFFSSKQCTFVLDVTFSSYLVMERTFV